MGESALIDSNRETSKTLTFGKGVSSVCGETEGQPRARVALDPSATLPTQLQARNLRPSNEGQSPDIAENAHQVQSRTSCSSALPEHHEGNLY
jgi:hypothetical protein